MALSFDTTARFLQTPLSVQLQAAPSFQSDWGESWDVWMLQCTFSLLVPNPGISSDLHSNLAILQHRQCWVLEVPKKRDKEKKACSCILGDIQNILGFLSWLTQWGAALAGDP